MAPEQDGIYGGNGHNVARASGEVKGTILPEVQLLRWRWSQAGRKVSRLPPVSAIYRAGSPGLTDVGVGKGHTFYCP